MINTASLASLTSSAPAKLPARLAGAGENRDESVEKARELKQAFSQFVGETFFGQMLKAMRSSVGEPAYFHGGMAEEQFQSRLDQQMSQDLASSGAGSLAEGLFRQQFPDEAQLLDSQQPAAQQPAASLADLGALRRR